MLFEAKKSTYWTSDKKQTFHTAYSQGKTQKEMIRDHFPELSLRQMDHHFYKLKNELGLPDRPKGNLPTHRDFRNYWTPEKKELLKGAYKTGKPWEAIHADHFPDLSFNQVRYALKAHKKELKLNSRPRGGVRHTINKPLDPTIHDRIVKLVSTTSMSNAKISNEVGASKSAVRKRSLKIRGPKFSKIKAEDVPNEHIEYASKLLGQKHEAGPTKRLRDHGPVSIAKRVNSKFNTKYSQGQIGYLIKKGHIKLKTDNQKGQGSKSMTEQYLYERELLKKVRAILSLGRNKAAPESSSIAAPAETGTAVASKARQPRPRTYTDVRHTKGTMDASIHDPEHTSDWEHESSRRLHHRTADDFHSDRLEHTRNLHKTVDAISQMIHAHAIQHGGNMPPEHADILTRLARTADSAKGKLGRIDKAHSKAVAAVRTNDLPDFLGRGVNTKRVSPPSGPVKHNVPTVTKKVDRSQLIDKSKRSRPE